MARIVAISNQKGGVGKTTMSVNLGKNLSRRGYRILMIDNDPQGNLSLALVGDQRPDRIAAGTGPGPANAYHLFIEGACATPLPVQDRLDLIGSSKHVLELSRPKQPCALPKILAFRAGSGMFIPLIHHAAVNPSQRRSSHGNPSPSRRRLSSHRLRRSPGPARSPLRS